MGRDFILNGNPKRRGYRSVSNAKSHQCGHCIDGLIFVPAKANGRPVFEVLDD